MVHCLYSYVLSFFLFFKQKTAYELRIRDWSSDVCSSDLGPFFHGTIADLRVGDFLTAGYRSNYRPDVVMNHIYFTASADGAGLAAEIAGELTGSGAVPRV